MKKILYLLIIGVAVIYLYPAKPDSAFYSIQSSVKSIGKTQADYAEELYYKEQELAAYEKAITDITKTFDNAIENAPICPTTGNKAITTITEDPRDELRVKCEELKLEIQKLEDKIN